MHLYHQDMVNSVDSAFCVHIVKTCILVPDWYMCMMCASFLFPLSSCTSQSRFENYFGGPYLELGHLLYHKLFGPTLSIEEEMFVSSMTVLERLSTNRGDHHEAESFYFRVFSEGKETIDRQGVCVCVCVCVCVYG